MCPDYLALALALLGYRYPSSSRTRSFLELRVYRINVRN
jgi:hypothetical protein